MSDNSDDTGNQEEDPADTGGGWVSQFKRWLKKGTRVARTRKGAVTLTAIVTFLVTTLTPALVAGLTRANLLPPPAQQSPAPVTPAFIVNKIYIGRCEGAPQFSVLSQSEKTTMPVVPSPAGPTPSPFHMTYKHNQYRPGEVASAKLNEVAELLMARPDLQVEIVGSADNSGGALTNHEMGIKRAGEAEKYLKDSGIDGTRISIRSIGAQTDGTAKDNRSVTISFHERGDTGTASFRTTGK